jgi:hypothetical protein
MKAGLLPPGIHKADLDEVLAFFGTTTWRVWLLEGLRLALMDLAAAGCGSVYLDGSFVTTKTMPNDYDVCWDMEGIDFDALDPVLVDVEWPRRAQKVKYRGDVLPNVTEAASGKLMMEFFQTDRETGASKGILLLDPRRVTS